jgi:hypothetical protein
MNLLWNNGTQVQNFKAVMYPFPRMILDCHPVTLSCSSHKTSEEESQMKW